MSEAVEEAIAALEQARKVIETQQSDIIMLEIERDGLNQEIKKLRGLLLDQAKLLQAIEDGTEIKKLKERNNNQAKLLQAIEDGTAKKCPDGGWYKP